ncbi:MAG: isocitrate lyase/phosphoenolpyruvate mutase family protein [Pseudomonadota bacterium]
MTHDPGPAFRALHRPGDPFILANAWDVGSARMLAALGAEAIGTSSAAHACTLGRADMGVTRDEALAHAESLVAATPLPVSGDFENGFGDDPETVAETVRLSCEIGLAGLSIEDARPPDAEAYGFEESVERIRAAASAARACPRDMFLVARADGVMNGRYDLEEGIRRLQAFEAAGADCLYLPLPPDMEAQARVCAAVSKPVNALAAGPFTQYSRAAFADAGVARISLGSALARATHRLIAEAGQAMFEAGDFSSLQPRPGPSIDALLQKGAREA